MSGYRYTVRLAARRVETKGGHKKPTFAVAEKDVLGAWVGLGGAWPNEDRHAVE